MTGIIVQAKQGFDRNSYLNMGFDAASHVSGLPGGGFGVLVGLDGWTGLRVGAGTPGWGLFRKQKSRVALPVEVWSRTA